MCTNRYNNFVVILYEYTLSLFFNCHDAYRLVVIKTIAI